MHPIQKDNNVFRKYRIINCKTLLKPVLAYVAKWWALITKTKSKVQSVEMRVIRLIRGSSRRDKMMINRIRQALDVASLLQDVERSKLRWYGHAKRMEEDRKPRKYPESERQGRLVGKLMKRWMEGVRDGLKKRGLEMEQIEEIHSYEDRVRLRQTVRSDIYLTDELSSIWRVIREVSKKSSI